MLLTRHRSCVAATPFGLCPSNRKIILVRTSCKGCFAPRYLYLATVLGIVVGTFAARWYAFSASAIFGTATAGGPYWDEGVYLVVAQRWLHGGLPYVAVWDQHPPGLPALLAVIQVIIPDPVLGARLAATIAVTMTALLIHRFCVRYANRPGAGLIGALLYILSISRWHGLAANTEVFNNACVTFAAYLLYGAASQPRNSLPRAVIAAVVLGLGLQIKYVVFPEAALLCLGFLIALYYRNRDVRAVIVAAGLLILAGCLPTGVAIAYFWAHGALRPFLDANIASNIAYLSVMPAISEAARSSASGLAPLAGSILVTGYAMARVRGRWRWTSITPLSPEAWITLWNVAAMADVCLPLKFFEHYFFALYPPLSLAGALALCVAARHRPKTLVAGLIVLFAIAIPLWIRGNAQMARGGEADAPHAVAEYLRQAGAADMNVFVYDYQPVIYALARLRPPTRYVLGAELSKFGYSAHVDGSAEIRRIMDESPDFVVIRGRLSGEFVPRELDDLVAQSLVNYHLVYQIVNGDDGVIVRIYRR
jgi:hypothetical protein